MIVQIYGISSADEAIEVVRAGVDHVGVVVGKGVFGNETTTGEARRIFASLPPEKKGVALSLSHNLNEISEVVEKTQPDILHLCALPDKIGPKDIVALKDKFPKLVVMRTIPIVNEGSVAIAKEYEGIADYLLLDSHKKGDWQIGATGKTHDWGISRRIVESVDVPAILAGGLGPENVEKAIRAVGPHGVDSMTKTNKLGGEGKDLTKVKEFVKRAKGEAAQESL